MILERRWTDELVAVATEVKGRTGSNVSVVEALAARGFAVSNEAVARKLRTERTKRRRWSERATELAARANPPPAEADDDGPPTQRSVREPDCDNEPTVVPSGPVATGGEQLTACRHFVERPAPRVIEPGPFDHERVLALPDQHMPCQNQAALDLAVAIGFAAKVTAIVNLGDALDFAPLSRHMRSKRIHSLRGEQDEGRKFFRSLDQIGARFKCLTMGNHDTYLARWIHSNAPALADIDGMDVDSMLGLSANGWRVVPYMEGLDMGGIHYTHEVGHCGIHAVRTSGEKMASAVVIGHVHSMTGVELHSIAGVPQPAHSFGWLGDHVTIDYKHRARAMREWPHGVGLIESDGKNTWVTPIVMRDNSRVAYVHGRAVRA
jgi:hypothetical protein